MPVRVRGFVFPAGAPIQPLDSLDVLDSAGSEKRFFWIDVEGELDAESEATFAARLDWHPTVFQSIRLPSSRPRMTPFEEYSHLTLHVLPPDASRSRDLRARELDLVLSRSYLITFHVDPMPMVDQLLKESSSLRPAPKSPDLLLHRILVAAVETIAPEVERMDDVIVALEEEVLYHPDPDLLERIVHARNGLFLLQFSLAPQLQIVKDLTAGVGRFVTPYARPYFKSLENRLRGILDDIGIYKEVCQNALDLYRSSITQKTNEVIRVLTAISIPLMVLTVLTGFYGMNVPLPFADQPHVFTWMLGFAAALFIGMLWWFRKRDWF